jgi:hypothetical protein
MLHCNSHRIQALNPRNLSPNQRNLSVHDHTNHNMFVDCVNDSLSAGYAVIAARTSAVDVVLLSFHLI